MFTNRSVNPSPNRTSIKEANDHLQLLHQRVMDLETTTQQQAEAMRHKDDLMRTTVREMNELKDAEISNLTTVITQMKDRIDQLEHLVKEKDSQIEDLTHRCHLADDVVAFTPTVEKLLQAMKKLPYKHGKHTSSRSKHKTNKTMTGKSERKSISSLDTVHSQENMVDGHFPNQSFADMRIARSFNINSNFSFSEDEQQSEIL